MITKIFSRSWQTSTRFSRLAYISPQYFATATARVKKTCYYKVLNISTDATNDEIKQSYLELAKKYHPDVLTGEAVQEVTKLLYT